MTTDNSQPPAAVSRRDFMRAAGFTLATATTGCARPPTEARSVHPDQLEAAAGRRESYATTCGACSAGCGVLASVRDHRPIKLEGLPGHPVSNGALCAGGQASVLGVYDDLRLRHPRMDGRRVMWEVLDTRLRAELVAADGAVRVLSSTEIAASPTTRRQIARFLDRFSDGRHDVYDVLSASAVADAHLRTHGVRAVPRFRFDRADVLVGFDADFLGTWISPVEFAGQYARSRPAWHVQYEAMMTISGAKANQRIPISPRDVGAVMTDLLQVLTDKDGNAPALPARQAAKWAIEIQDIAERLRHARGRALVVSGSGDPELQACANHINERIGAYGTTIDLARPSHQRLGDDQSLRTLMAELRNGRVGVLIVCGTNPVHDLPDGANWRELLRRVPVLVSISERLDETSELASYLCPPPHFLESWGDYEPVAGLLCLKQPVTVASGNPRSLDQSLAAWSGSIQIAGEILKTRWREEVYDPDLDGGSFQIFWDRSLRQGWLDRPAGARGVPRYRGARTLPVTIHRSTARSNDLLLVGYPSIGMLDGRQSFNPWLLELPDPITRVTWESCASLSPETARTLGVADGDVIRIRPTGGSQLRAQVAEKGSVLEVPVIVQPGQHDDVVAVPIGYGQQISARFADFGPRWLGARTGDSGGALVGANIAPLLGAPDHGGIVGPSAVTVTATSRRVRIATTQKHGWLNRTAGGSWGSGGVDAVLRRGSVRAPSHVDEALWEGSHRHAGSRWGMVIDLDACTGCSACVVACQIENNTPVVGRDEVLRGREMHWLRIDRYYLGDPSNPAMAHQPVTCHHCGRAPCESVCPVLATTHSRDGLNQQIYSRCVGTRYCLNNCPLRVRRFNWFDHEATRAIPNPALNPDVTVRSRGVAEKCTFCVQRIQDARLQAQQEGRELRDGDVIPACAQTCPAGAITFGDLNEPGSRVRRLALGERAYTLFEELNLEPAVHYLTLRRRLEPREPDESSD